MSPFDHPDLEDIALTDILAALGDPVRLAIVTDLAQHAGAEVAWSRFEFDVTKATLSYHMKALRQAGLIFHRKEGTRCFVSLRQELDKIFPGLLAAVLKANG